MRRQKIFDGLVRIGLLMAGLVVLGFIVWTLSQRWLDKTGGSEEEAVALESPGVSPSVSGLPMLTSIPAGEAQVLAPANRAQATDFTLSTLSGSEVTLSDFRGQRVLVNFWATWCAPCRIEMPAIESIYQRYQDQGVVILALNLAEKASVIQPYVDELGLTFPVLLDTDGAVSRQYAVRGLPTSVFIGQDGLIYRQHIGPMNEAFIEETLAEMEQDTP